jgi:hypothetical protein
MTAIQLLTKQEFQNEVGIPNPESLADLYFKVTHFSLAMARVVGLADEEVVQSLALPILPIKVPKVSLSRLGSIGSAKQWGTGGLHEVSN